MSSPRRDSRLADASRHDANSCQELSALVMALFDGETDELQTRRARNHLLVCQTCANRWLDWNRARSLLLDVPAPAPPETLVWRVLMACRGAASRHTPDTPAPKTGRARHQSNRVSTSNQTVEGVPAALSGQILARTSRAAQSGAQVGEIRTVPSFSRRARALSWPMAFPAAALWLLILQREPLLSARFESDAAPAPAASRPLHGSLFNEETAAHSAASLLAASRHRVFSPSTPVSSADLRAAKRQQTLFDRDASPVSSPSPAFPNAPEADLNPQPIAVSEANSAANAEILQRQWQEIEALTSQASRSVEWQSGWQTAAFNPGTTPQFENLETRADRGADRGADRADVRFASQPKARLRAKIAVGTLQKQLLSQRAARLSSEQPALRLRAAGWKVSAPRGASLIETSLPQTMPSRVSLPAASAPSAARLIAENFDTEAGRVDEMRSVVDDFRATVAPDETQNPDDEDNDWG